MIVNSKITALSQTIVNSTLIGGVSALIQAAGLGKLAPNTMVLEFPENWRECSEAKLQEFVDVVKFCLLFDMAILIARAPKFVQDENATQARLRILRFFLISIVFA